MKMLESAISVKQLNYYVKSMLEADSRLSYVSVEGEISNFKNHYQSGHMYFTVKDNDAAIRCVMFKSYAQKVDFTPEDGMHVIVSGRVSLYEKDGQYQFYADNMVLYGEGNLALEFKRVKEKLEKEGLFDESTKRPINKNPKRVAVLTSNTGAALHDILTTLQKRMPSLTVVVCPVIVQGDTAPKSIMDTLDRVYALSNIDTIIIARGGGSFEDLACFNDEALARKIYESPVPVISGVGHETDFTICDFVSDFRAATPTAAAVCATTDIAEVKEKLERYRELLKNRMTNIFERLEYKYNTLAASRYLKYPTEVIDGKMQTVDFLTKRMVSCANGTYSLYEKRFLSDITMLESLSPLKTIKRGFAIAQKGENIVESAKDMNIGDNITLKMKDGTVDCSVTGKSYE